MKLFLLLMFGVLCRGNLLDRGYLPPPGAKTSGGSPGAIDVPLETPLETPASSVRSRPLQGSFTGRYNVRPDDQNAYATTPSALDSEALPQSMQPGSVNLPTTTQTSFAFSQTTTYSPLQNIQCNEPECVSDYRFPASLPDQSYGVRPGSILNSSSAANAPKKTEYKTQPYIDVPGSNLPFQPISDFGSTTQSAQAFQPYGSTSQSSQIPDHLQTTIASESPRDQTIKPGTGSINDQIPTRGYEPARDGFRDITSSAQKNDANNLPSSSEPQSGQSTLPISGSNVPDNKGYQPGRDSFTQSGLYPTTQDNRQNLPIPSVNNIPTNLVLPGSQATGPSLFSPTTSHNLSNQPTLGTQPLTPSVVPNVPAYSGPLAGFPSNSARDFTSGPNQYSPFVLPSGSIIKPGAPAFDPNAPSRFGSIEEAQRYFKPSLDSNATILNYDNVITPEGYFSYNFDTSNGIHADEAGDASDGVKAEGSYSYTGDDGQFYRVTYTADENGYQPKGDHLPTPPPIPEAIQRVIEQSVRDQAAGIVPDPGFYDEEKYGYKKYHEKGGQDLPSYQASNRRGPSQQGGSVDRYSQVLPERKPPSSYGIPSEISRVNDGRISQTDESIKQGTLRPSYDNKYRIPGQDIRDKVISKKPTKYLPDTNLSQNAQKVPYEVQQISSTIDPYRGPENSMPREQSTPVTGSSDQIGLNISPDQSITVNEHPNLIQSPTTSAPKIYDLSRAPPHNVSPSGEEYNQFGQKSSTPSDQNHPDKSYINGIRPTGPDVFGRPISQKIIPVPGTESNIPQEIASKPYKESTPTIRAGSGSVFTMTRPTQISTHSKIPADRTSYEPIADQRQDSHDYENQFSIPARVPIYHEVNTDSRKPGATISTSTGVFPQRQQTSTTGRPSGESRTSSGYHYNVPAQRLDTEENQNQRYQPGKIPSSVRRPSAGGIPENIEGASTVVPSTFSPVDNVYPSTVGLKGIDFTKEPEPTRKTGRPSPGSDELFNVTPDNLAPIETVTDYGHPTDGEISTLSSDETTRGNIKYNQDRLTTITPSKDDSATQPLSLDDSENKQSQETFPYQYSTSIPSSPGLVQQMMVPKVYPIAGLGQTQFPGVKHTTQEDDSLRYTHPDIIGAEEPFEPIRSIYDEIGIPKEDSIFKGQPTLSGQPELPSKQPFQGPGQQIDTNGPSRFESTQLPDDQSTYQQNVPQRGSTFETPQIPGSRPSTSEADAFIKETSGTVPGSPSTYMQPSTSIPFGSQLNQKTPSQLGKQTDIDVTGLVQYTKSRPEYPDTRHTTSRPGYTDATGTTPRLGFPDVQSTSYRPGYPNSRYTTLKPEYTDTHGTKFRPGYPNEKGTSLRPGYPDLRYTTSRPSYTDGLAIGSIDSRQNISRPGYHDMRYTTDKPGYPDVQGTTSRPAYLDTRYTTGRRGYPDAQDTTSRPGHLDTRYTTTRPSYPDMRYTTGRPGYPDSQGTTSRSGYSDTRYTTARPANLDAQGTSSRPVYSDEQGTTTRPGYPDSRYTTSRPRYPAESNTTIKPGYTYTQGTPSRYTTSRPRYPDERYTTSQPGYTDRRYTTSRPGHPDTQVTTLKPGFPDAQGTTSRPRYTDERYTTSRPGYPSAQGTSPRPGYPDTRYTTFRPGHPDTQVTTLRPEYPDAQGTTSRPGYPSAQGNSPRPGYPDTRYTTSRPGYPDTQVTTLRPGYPDAQGTTSRPRYPDERYTTSRPGYPSAQGTSPRPGYPDTRYTTFRPGYPDTQVTTLRPGYPDAQGTTSRPRYPDERYTNSRPGYPSAQGTSPRPEYPDTRYTTSRPGYPDKTHYSSVPSSVGQTQPQQNQGSDRESTGVPDEERKYHGSFEPMIEQKLQGEVPRTPGQFGSKISTFPKVKGEMFSPSRQPPRYDPETGYHY